MNDTTGQAIDANKIVIPGTRGRIVVDSATIICLLGVDTYLKDDATITNGSVVVVAAKKSTNTSNFYTN